MIDGYVYKTPSEIVNLVVDFTRDIPSGDSIVSIGGGSATGAAATDSAGTNATSTVIAATTLSSPNITVQLQAGTEWQNYLIVVTAEMSTANTKISKIYELRIRADRKD